MENCIFCKKYKEKKEVIYENKFFYSQFDKFPVSPGHSEVIPIRHVISLTELTEEEWQKLLPAIKSTMNIITKTNLVELYHKILENPLNEKSTYFCKKMLKHPSINLSPDAYNHGVNDGREAGRTVDHLHWHIIPRYKSDIDDPTGGVRGVIPWAMNYKK